MTKRHLKDIETRNRRSFKDIAVVAALVLGIAISGYSVANAHQPVKQADAQTMTASASTLMNDC